MDFILQTRCGLYLTHVSVPVMVCPGNDICGIGIHWAVFLSLVDYNGDGSRPLHQETGAVTSGAYSVSSFSLVGAVVTEFQLDTIAAVSVQSW